MAKICMKEREVKRQRVANRFSDKRSKLKTEAQRVYAKGDIPWDALEKLQKMPRNASPMRQRNRCRICGRPHGVYKKFGLCRIHLRNFAMLGYIPGLRKASW